MARQLKKFSGESEQAFQARLKQQRQSLAQAGKRTQNTPSPSPAANPGTRRRRPGKGGQAAATAGGGPSQGGNSGLVLSQVFSMKGAESKVIPLHDKSWGLTGHSLVPQRIELELVRGVIPSIADGLFWAKVYRDKSLAPADAAALLTAEHAVKVHWAKAENHKCVIQIPPTLPGKGTDDYVVSLFVVSKDLADKDVTTADAWSVKLKMFCKQVLLEEW